MKRVIRAVHPIKRQIIQTEYSGDLFVTMYSPFSRNRQLGNLIGKGYSLSAARSEMKMVAEGYYAAKLIREVKREREVKMPIASAVYKILYENASPKKTLRALAEKLK
jgi:glycerol-3-phosphate dehydrogenase (NAD(P)+)